jgi:hypothetical protein
VRTQNAAENLALARGLVASAVKGFCCQGLLLSRASAVKQDGQVDAGTKKQTEEGRPATTTGSIYFRIFHM